MAKGGTVGGMLPRREGAIRLFRFAGINVFLHWSWFLVAVYSIQQQGSVDGYKYSSMLWNVYQYLSLFAIVLIHEFGHALACRQVGGTAKEIILWPFGGVAFVSPPPRPGAVLWSIAAGPLVNVVLLPVTYYALKFAAHADLFLSMPDAYHLLKSIFYINCVLLIFNMCPVYPLDGGQILRSLLWFWMGPTRSLLVATAIGFVGATGLAAFAISEQSVWLGIMAFFIFMQCVRSWAIARAAARVAVMPRRAGVWCPACGASPVVGEIWVCGQCRKTFDPFVTQAVCPQCGAVHPTTQCVDCRVQTPIEQWVRREQAPSAEEKSVKSEQPALEEKRDREI